MRKDIVKKFKGREFDVQSANAPLFLLDFIYLGYITSKKIHRVAYEPVFAYMPEEGDFYQFLDRNLVLKVGRNIYKRYILNNGSLDLIILKHIKLGGKLEQLWQAKPKMSSNHDFGVFLNSYLKIAQEWWRYAVVGEDKGLVITDQVMPKFASRHGISLAEAQKVVSVMSHPKQQSIINAERLAYLCICQMIHKKRHLGTNRLMLDKPLMNLVDDYLSDFFWVKSNFSRAVVVDARNVVEQALNHVRKAGILKIKEEIKKIRKNTSLIARQQAKIRRQFKFGLADEKDIDFAQKISYWVENRKLMMMKHVYYANIALEEAVLRLGINIDVARRCTPEEILRALISGRAMSEKIISARKGPVFIVYENDKHAFYYGKQARELFGVINGGASEHLKGMVASSAEKNSIRGRVSVVINPEKDKFKKGDILITSMTRVEFIPLMRQAKAIITNEGGIACHAAIVSRELGIPCIIGTKHATEILNTGDCVEMNLETGEIKVIKKKI